MALELPPQHWRRPLGTGTSHLFAVHLTPSAEPPEAHGWKTVCGYDLHKLTGPRAGATWSGPLRTPGELTTPHKGRERSKCPKCVAVLERWRAAWATHGHELAALVTPSTTPEVTP